jgi:thiamine-phosphate pyrophosphorylase
VRHNFKSVGRLHVITDTVIQNRLTHAEIADMAIRGGADCIQLRDKNLPQRDLTDVAGDVLRVCRRAGVPLIINDNVEVASAVDADGVHLGRSDKPIAEARSVLGPDKIIGGSAGSVSDLVSVERDGADYAGYGHIFATSSKVKAGEPVGVGKLAEGVRSVGIPVIAIGGITVDNLESVMMAGAWGAAVIGAVCGAEDPRKAAQILSSIIAKTRGE